VIDNSPLAEFARRKEKAAKAATLETFETVADHSARFDLESISSPFSDALLDGPFFQSPAPSADVPAISLVFVQSRDGNTEADDPSSLGGGATDKHVIYEGLSRISADAVMAGAKTARGNMLFSVWHPSLVSLRQSLGKPRHPAQIVISGSGELSIEEGMLFNVPDVPVVIVSAGEAAERLTRRTSARSWITVIDTGERLDLRRAAERMRGESGLQRISAIGGRATATSLMDAGLVTDLYLTTSPVDAGTPHTPMYCGTRRVERDLVVRKQSAGGIVFEHLLLHA